MRSPDLGSPPLTWSSTPPWGGQCLLDNQGTFLLLNTGKVFSSNVTLTGYGPFIKNMFKVVTMRNIA